MVSLIRVGEKDFFWVRANADLGDPTLIWFTAIVVVIKVPFLDVLLYEFAIEAVISLAAFPFGDEQMVATVIALFDHELKLEFFTRCFFFDLSHRNIDKPNVSCGPSHFHASFPVVFIWAPITTKCGRSYKPELLPVTGLIIDAKLDSGIIQLCTWRLSNHLI
jgi:hypothetical protein